MVIGGENNHVTAIINQVQGVKLSDEEMRAEIGRYLATVVAENSHIRLTGIQRQGAQRDGFAPRRGVCSLGRPR